MTEKAAVCILSHNNIQLWEVWKSHAMWGSKVKSEQRSLESFAEDGEYSAVMTLIGSSFHQ